MGFNKKFYQTGGLVASTPPSGGGGLDPLQNFETVTYTGNGSTQKITGYIRKGAAFNGSSSVITLPTALSDGATTDASCISFWFNTGSEVTSSTPGNEIMSFAFSGGATGKIALGSTTGNFNGETFSVSSDITTQYTYSTTNIPAGWNHAVVQWNSGTTKWDIYINGVAHSTSTFGTNEQGKFALKFGNRNSFYYDGKLDQVRIFNRALDSGEVGQLALETYADPKKSTTDYFGDGSGVALYELDEDANDTGAAIDSGQSANFPTTSSYIQSSYTHNSNDFTISMWVKANSLYSNVGSDTYPFVTTGTLSGANTNNGGIWFDGSKIRIHGSTAYGDYSYSFQTNTWYHIGMTYNSSTDNIQVIINGQLYSPTIIGTPTFTNPDGLRIGQGGQASYSFDGLIDDFRIYSSVLNATEVANIYNNNISSIPTSTLGAYYKLDGNGNDETTNYNATSVNNITYSDEVAGIYYNGTPTNVNFLGMAFQPDFVWIKDRSTAYQHQAYDSVRGATQKILPSSTAAEVTDSTGLTSFDSNGFSISTNVGINTNGNNYVAWCWKGADTTTTIPAGTVGNTIASDVRANTAAGFSIVKHTAPSSEQNYTIGHGLSQKPDMVILKGLDSASSWFVWHKDLSVESYYLYLNEAFSESDLTQDTRIWGQQSFTDTVISVRSNYSTLLNQDYIAYCFHSVDGYQKVGSYTGTGVAGNAQNIGFDPRFILFKNTSSTGQWWIHDAVRGDDKRLFTETSAAESTSSALTTSNTGFSFNDANANLNALNNVYIYLAIA